MGQALRRLVRRRALSRAELLEEAQRLGLRGRSKMDAGELAEAIRATRGEPDSRGFVGALAPSFSRAFRGLRSVFSAGLALAFLRRPKPVRILVLSLSTLAAGGLGLMTAYAVSPEDDLAAQVLVTNGSTLQIGTVTGPGGTTTVAVTKTKEGKTKLVPVRILDTVTGPGGTETVSVAVVGPPVTVTDTSILTQIQTNTLLLTETQVLTQVITQPVTVVVTDVVTVNLVDTQLVTVTDTVVETTTVVITETVQPPPP